MRSAQGYVASSIVIVLSAALLISLLSRNIFLYRTRMAVLGTENKIRSRELADSCLTIAVLMLIEDKGYSPATEITRTIGAETCSIISIKDVGGEIVVRTSATIGRFVTNLEGTLDVNTLTIIRKREYGHF